MCTSGEESEGSSGEEEEEEEEIKMVLVVRNDLKMGKGKVCAITTVPFDQILRGRYV